MTDPNPHHDPDDPRGVASPPDPHGENHESSGGGDGIDDRLKGKEYPDRPDREDQKVTCERCGKEFHPLPDQKHYCDYCKEKVGSSGPGPENPDRGSTEDLESWSIDRVAVAVVDAASHTAQPLAKAGLEQGVDDGGYFDSARVIPAAEFDDEPPFPLSERFEQLPGLAALDDDAAEALLAGLRDQNADEPQLYTEYGTPLDIDCTREAIRNYFGSPNDTLHLYAGVVETVTRSLPDELSTDDDGDEEHWAAAYPSEHERAMEAYREKHGRYPFEEPDQESDDELAPPQ